MNVKITNPDVASPFAFSQRAGQETSRILVVDDVEDNREILTRRLVRRGFEVLEACSGTEALELVERESIDLILMDIMMPDLSGIEVVRRIRRTRSQADLPIIMVSAKTLSEDVAESLEAGANGYIIKPVDFPLAFARIQAQLDRKRVTAERALKAHAEKRHLETTRRLLVADNLRSRQRLEYLAFHDDLTGLTNRVAFRDMLEKSLADESQRTRQPALLFIDLDRFKAINDVYGHQVGDELLKRVGARLLRLLDGAIAVGRLGGDEFAALIAERDSPRSAIEYAEAIVAAMSEPFEIGQMQKLRIGATVGTAGAALCHFDAETMMKAADLAMYRAKAAGRGGVMAFEPQFLEEQRERSALEVELRHAVTSEQFEVYYQPLVDARTRQPVSFEALVRWNHAERGVIPPSLFISAAEDSGLINPLGTWVLRRACRDAARWPDHLRVSVNLSPRQFNDADLIETIARALRDSGLPAHRLEVELTETCLLEAGEKNVAVLERIRALGVRVAIDDFGTGYSSMSYLQSFVFDKLKIDRRFIKELDDNPKTSAIITAIVQLGTTIGISTAAEGVETEAQYEAVVRHGFSEVQGFLIARPQTLPRIMANHSEWFEHRDALSG